MWLSVDQVADRLQLPPHKIRRMIGAGELPASRSGKGARAPWVIDSAALERQIADDAARRERAERMKGVVVGYGDFPDKMTATYGQEAGEHARRSREAMLTLDALADQLGPLPEDLAAELAGLDDQADDDDLVRRYAEFLVAEYRRQERSERIRRRAIDLAETILASDET